MGLKDPPFCIDEIRVFSCTDHDVISAQFHEISWNTSTFALNYRFFTFILCVNEIYAWIRVHVNSRLRVSAFTRITRRLRQSTRKCCTTPRYFRIPGLKEAMPLIDAGLKSPQGLAVDAKRELLYVADPDQRKVAESGRRPSGAAS